MLEITPQGMIIGRPVISGTSGSVLFVDSDGNLAQNNANLFWDNTNTRFGIGTTSPALPFDMVGRAQITASSEQRTLVLNNSSVTGSVLDLNATAAGGRDYHIYSSANAAGAGGGRFAILDATASVWRMVIDSTGNVGIGTTVPATILDVNGVTTGRGTSGGDIFLARADNPASGTQNIFRYVNAANSAQQFGIRYNVANASYEIATFTASTPMAFLVNGSEFMRIASSGNVGIGTTNPNLALLQVAGNAAVTGSLRIGDSGPSDILHIGKSSNYNMFFDQTGTAAANNSATFYFRAKDTGGNIRKSSSITMAQESTAATIAPGYISMNTIDASGQDIERLRITSSGNVGIGTTTPNANAILDVSSTTKAFMPPRMTTVQRDAVASPTAGMVIYNSSSNKLNVYTTVWEAVTSA